jgi:3-phosphoshikimate 1-carboxyvinyltransferase
MIVRVSKKNKSVKGIIHLPPSKSIYNRALIIRALCGSDFKITPPASANDSILLERLLKNETTLVDAEDAGTTFRFLTAYLASREGEFLLTGTERMQQRPMGILVEALRQLGAEIEYVNKTRYPPLKINGRKLKGGKIAIDASVSSQFVSALLLIAPVVEGGIELIIQGEISSRPYIELTLHIMEYFGVKAEWKGNVISIKEQKYLPQDIAIESDWSAASYWYEIATLSEQADITLSGLNEESSQGDNIIEDMMKPFGVETEYLQGSMRICKNESFIPEIYNCDFKSCPDLFQTMAATCSALNVKTGFEGIENVRIKETDRLMAIEIELSKLKSGTQRPIRFQTYNDHRMAMCLAPLALKFGVVEIENPEVVRKSYSEFWNDLRSVGFDVEMIQN